MFPRRRGGGIIIVIHYFVIYLFIRSFVIYRYYYVRPSVRPTWTIAQLGAQRLGLATSAVRTADPSAHGRRSAAIGGGISSRRAPC